MSKQIFVVLILALLASVGGWLLLNNQVRDQQTTGVLFDDIGNYATDIDEVLVENNEGVVMKAKRMASISNGRSGQTFPIDASEMESQRRFIDSAAGTEKEFAADQRKLAELVSALVKTKLVEPKTSQPAKYERLGLQSLDATNSQAIKVSIKSANKVWQVLVGREATAGSGFYIRKPNEQQTWLSDQKFDTDETQDAWLNRTLFDFSVDNIRAVRRSDEEQWTIEKTSDNTNNEFKLVDREDSTLKYDSVLTTYAESIATLSFQRLSAMDEVFWESLQTTVAIEVETFAGDKYQLFLAENDDGQYLKITSTIDTTFWQQWLFQVSNYTKTQLNKFHDDFLADNVSAENELNE